MLEAQIEVEYVTAALDLTARGVGDTVTTRSVLDARGFQLHTVSLDPPLLETFAFITRRNARLSPATREFMAMAEARLKV